MNEPLYQKQISPANETVWKRVMAFIQTIVSDSELDFPLESIGETETFDRDRAAFTQAIRQERPASSPSVIERWTLEHSQRNWLTRIQERLNAIETACASEEILAFFHSLCETMETLSSRMVPAPAYRDAAAVKEYVYQPRRRAIEPADLPAFNPLFCTAIDPQASPFAISGLRPEAQYRFSLCSVQDRDLTHEETVTASANGTVNIDVAGILVRLTFNRDDPGDFVWFLHETRDEDGAPGAWTSGLVWLESQNVRQLTNEAIRLLADQTRTDRRDTPIETLLDINLLASRGYFMKTYERARQELIFSPMPDREMSQVPFKESLWYFVNMIVKKMLVQIEESEPVFRRIQPDWNAAQSLRSFRERLTEWE